MTRYTLSRDGQRTLRNDSGDIIGTYFEEKRGFARQWFTTCASCPWESDTTSGLDRASTDLLLHAENTHACRFCLLGKNEETRRFGSVAVLEDGYPVTPGHTLIIPVVHRHTYFDLTDRELRDVHRALAALHTEFGEQGVTDFNIGWNAGVAAGQTVAHAHCHLIPRRRGDVEDPTGGVRGVIPDKRTYLREEL